MSAKIESAKIGRLDTHEESMKHRLSELVQDSPTVSKYFKYTSQINYECYDFKNRQDPGVEELKKHPDWKRLYNTARRICFWK